MTTPYRIRDAEVWARARDDYLAGMDAESVCRRHDLGLSAFRRRARKFGWRRLDQPDAAAGVMALAIYRDVDADEQIDVAYRRFIQALDEGRALEAVRWRRLWRQLCEDRAAVGAEIVKRGTTQQICAHFLDPYRARDSEDERLGEALRRIPPAAPENVHDVHSNFSGVHISPPPDSAPAGDPPPDALPGLEHRHAQGRGGDPEQGLARDGGDHGEDQPRLAPDAHAQADEQADPAAHGDHGDQPGEGPQEPAAPSHGGPGGGGGGFGLDGHRALPRKSLSDLKVHASARVFHRVGKITRRP